MSRRMLVGLLVLTLVACVCLTRMHSSLFEDSNFSIIVQQLDMR